MTLYVGIDNGKKGGIAIIDEKEEIQMLVPMPVTVIDGHEQYDINAIAKVFEDLPDERVYVCLEKAYTLPLNGCKQNFVTGYQWGVMMGVLSAFHISYEIINPKAWQKEIFAGDTVENTKEASILFCKRKWPNIDLKVGNKESDGLSDALCMALFIFRKNGGQAK